MKRSASAKILALYLLCALSAGGLLGVIDVSRAQPADSSATNGSTASVAGAAAKQDGAAAALSEIKFDDAPPPPIPATPAPVSPALAPFVKSLPAADTAALHVLGQSIARQLNQSQDEGQRRLLVEAGTQLLKEIDRREAPPAGGQTIEPGFSHPDIDKTAYRQAVNIARDTVGLVNVNNAGASPEPIKEISRSAWEGGPKTTPVTLSPGGTHFFSGAISAPSGTGLVYVPPPPPSPVAIAGIEKGVRIAFDATTLRLAEKRLPSLDALEDRLRGARSSGDVSQALTWLNGRIATALDTQNNTAELNHAVVVSLRDLIVAAAPFRDRWDALPENLRHPGQLRRIHGLLIDADKNDLLLIGSSDGPGEPITIDELIAGFRSVWRDAATPLCSLEPDPSNVGGPQRAVIAGVDRNTQFAHIMLDADYTMKRVIFGQEHFDSPGFVDLYAAYTAYCTSEGKENAALANHWMARFWFMPVPPAQGAIRLSFDGRLAMFDCRVQVLTEDLARRGNVLGNAGTRNPVIQRMTDHFSEHFGEFETQFPVIGQLHALCDIALAAQVARNIGAPRDLLAKLVDLPIRSVEVPAAYAGLNVPIEVQNIHVGAIQGGVNMVMAIAPDSMARVPDSASELFARQALAASGITRDLPDDHPHYIPSKLAAALTGDTPLARAGGLIAGGNFDVAIALLDRTLADDPGNVPARRMRLRALAGRGLFRLAERELEIISMLENTADIEDLRLKLHLDRGDPILPASIPDDRRERLLSLYLNEAAGQAAANNFSAAIKTAGHALALSPNDGELIIRRAEWELAEGNADGAMIDFKRAIDLSPRAGRPLLARAQAEERLGRLRDALADANSALALDSSLSEAYCVRLEVALFDKDADLRAAYADTKMLQALTPNDPMLYVYRAQILVRQGDRDGAMAAANRAVKLGPGIAQAYCVRARLLAQQVKALNNFYNLSAQQENEDRFIRMFSDYNAAIGMRGDDWETREMRAAALLDLTANIGQPAAANLDWQKLLTVAMGAVINSPQAIEILGRAFGGKSGASPDVATSAMAIKLGLLYAADDDLKESLAHAPRGENPTIESLETQVRQRIQAITKGTPP